MSEAHDAMPGGSEHRPPPSAPPPEPPQRRRGSGGTSFDPEAWMVTFSDLLNLLMTFFVLIFATQDPVPAAKLQQAFGQSVGVFGLFRTSFLEQIVAVPQRDLSQDLVRVFLNEIGANDIEVEQDPRGLVITLPTDTTFAPGSATLNERARKRIDQLAVFLAATRHRIRVEGYSDNRERASPPYPSTWELSLARAHRVLLRLIAHGIHANRLSLIGYGPAHPRFDNRTAQGRARNRRVDIVILNRFGAAVQP